MQTQHTPAISTKHVCRWCHKSFVREATYINHECSQMKREKELTTLDGQAAWQYYHTWMMKKKRMPPTSGSFVVSKLFRTFINFAKFAKKVQLPIPNIFIDWTIKKDYPPTMWTIDEVYVQYIDFVDNNLSPMDQVKTSITTLLNCADNHNIDTSEVFTYINPNELIHLVRIRKLSPWLLLASKKFGNMFATLNNEQQSILESIIKPEEWANKRAAHLDDVEMIKNYVRELGI